VRTVVVVFLIGILLACPLLCKAEGPGCCADSGVATGTHHDDSDEPSRSQSDAVSCICAGAIKDLNPSGQHLDLTPTLQPLDSFFLPTDFLTCSSLFLHHGRDGDPPGVSESGTLRIHAYLNNYRC
jgi:hypothetical protein